jgi:probable F420-dependent oxidoreductase
VSDYLDRQAPFLALAAAAEATTRPTVGTYVLNAGFYRPALLARDVTSVMQLTGGRLELGIGTGYAKAEFAAADVSWGTTRDRIDHLSRTVTEVRKLAGEHAPPVLIGGNGPQVLAVAAEHADIISTTGAHSRTERNKPLVVDYRTLSERVDGVRQAVSNRISDVEMNLLIHVVKPTEDKDGGLAFLSAYADHVSAEDVARLPTLLGGTDQAMAEKLLRCRETLGFSYFTVLEPFMAAFANVMNLLR